MRSALRKLFALALILVLTVGAMPTAKATGDEKWVDNVLTRDPMDALGIGLDTIASVTFLDTTEDAPKYCWYMGTGAVRSVLGWVKWDMGYAHVYLAADGGINGEKSAAGLFKDCKNLTEVNFNGAYHTERCLSMKEMFHGCASLREVDLSGLDTSQVESMYGMFRGCTSLTELDVSGFDTSSVTSMYTMFSTCTHLTELDLSGFDTSRVTSIGFMFSACRRLEKVDVAGFDTGNVINMEGVFRWCDEIRDLDLSGWDISSVQKYSDFMDDGAHVNGRPWTEFFG